MSIEKWLKDKLKTFEKDLDYRLETLILDLTEQISKRMKEMKINRVKLSKLLNISPPAVTKILNGNSNFTLKTLLHIADALKQDLKIEFIDKRIPIYETVSDISSANDTLFFKSASDASFATTIISNWISGKIPESGIICAMSVSGTSNASVSSNPEHEKLRAAA